MQICSTCNATLPVSFVDSLVSPTRMAQSVRHRTVRASYASLPHHRGQGVWRSSWADPPRLPSRAVLPVSSGGAGPHLGTPGAPFVPHGAQPRILLRMLHTGGHTHGRPRPSMPRPWRASRARTSQPRTTGSIHHGGQRQTLPKHRLRMWCAWPAWLRAAGSPACSRSGGGPPRPPPLPVARAPPAPRWLEHPAARTRATHGGRGARREKREGRAGAPLGRPAQTRSEQAARTRGAAGAAQGAHLCGGGAQLLLASGQPVLQVRLHPTNRTRGPSQRRSEYREETAPPLHAGGLGDPGSVSHRSFAIVIRDLEQVHSRQVISARWPASIFELSKSKKRA